MKISELFPDIKKFFYAMEYSSKDNFCSFIKPIKEDIKKFEALAKILAKKIEPDKKNIDIFVSIPKHLDNSNEIDYAKILATILSKELNISYKDDIIVKIKPTRKLKMIPTKDREAEIFSAFQVSDNGKDLKICIVDDILSSGATLKETVKTFQLKNFANISIAVLIVQNS